MNKACCVALLFLFYELKYILLHLYQFYINLSFLSENIFFTMLTSNKIIFARTSASRYLQSARYYSSDKNVTDVDYQYIQKSRVPTMHFQKSLPRLPIPELAKTGERYLNAIKPLLNKEQLVETERLTNDLVSNSGIELQKKLIAKDKANKHTSYISEYWFDLYLRDRAALPINYNPIIVFQNDTKPAYNDQLIRATNLLISSVRFMLSLRQQILEPEVFHLNAKKSNTEWFRTVTGFLPEAVSWLV